MRRCKSWRYVNVGHRDHLPGQCRKCWRPCSNRIEKLAWRDGVRRCDDCVQAMLYLPNTAVRRALADEPGQQRDVLVALTSDPDGAVAHAAASALAGGAAASPSPTTPYATPAAAPRAGWDEIGT